MLLRIEAPFPLLKHVAHYAVVFFNVVNEVNYTSVNLCVQKDVWGRLRVPNRANELEPDGSLFVVDFDRELSPDLDAVLLGLVLLCHTQNCDLCASALLGKLGEVLVDKVAT